jgi:hypothetical protein
MPLTWVYMRPLRDATCAGEWRAHSSAELYVVHVVEPIGLFAESVLQTYLDEQALSELAEQGINTVMANIELRVLDSFREELQGGEQELQVIRSVKVIQGEPASDSRPVAESSRLIC